MTTKTPWSVRVRRDDVPETGLHLDLVADQSTRDAVAVVAGVSAVPRLTVRFDVTRRSGSLHVVGEVEGSVGQTCVVTLESITSEVREPIDLVFVPAASRPEPAETEEAPIDPIDSAAADEPELLVDGTADLGAVAVEFFMLGIDPYPRKPGAVFERPKVEDAGNHPFAALAALKKGAPERKD